jgi:hypothetical protein
LIWRVRRPEKGFIELYEEARLEEKENSFIPRELIEGGGKRNAYIETLSLALNIG